MKRVTPWLRSMTWLSCAFALLIVVATPRSAHALLNAGAEAGLVKRSADAPANLKLGFGYGLHGELSMLPFIMVGPYYLHYQLGVDGADGIDNTFNTLGLRARLMLPLPGSDIHPYGYVGIGYTWASLSGSFGVPGVASVEASTSGHFLETPIGIGLAYSVLPLLQISIEGAYRPGFSFGGDLYSNAPDGAKPSSGWSALIGAAIDL